MLIFRLCLHLCKENVTYSNLYSVALFQRLVFLVVIGQKEMLQSIITLLKAVIIIFLILKQKLGYKDKEQKFNAINMM